MRSYVTFVIFLRAQFSIFINRALELKNEVDTLSSNIKII